MLMSTDVASIMLPVSRGIMDRERDIDTAAGPHASAAGGPAAVRGMKRGDPEPDAQTAAALTDLAGAECKRPRIDGTGSVVGDIGQVGMQCKHMKYRFVTSVYRFVSISASCVLYCNKVSSAVPLFFFCKSFCSSASAGNDGNILTGPFLSSTT